MGPIVGMVAGATPLRLVVCVFGWLGEHDSSLLLQLIQCLHITEVFLFLTKKREPERLSVRIVDSVFQKKKKKKQYHSCFTSTGTPSKGKMLAGAIFIGSRGGGTIGFPSICPGITLEEGVVEVVVEVVVKEVDIVLEKVEALSFWSERERKKKREREKKPLLYSTLTKLKRGAEKWRKRICFLTRKTNMTT